MASINYPLLLGYRGPKPTLRTARDTVEELKRLRKRILTNEEIQRRGKKVSLTHGNSYQYPPNPERAALHAELARNVEYVIDYLRTDCKIAEEK